MGTIKQGVLGGVSGTVGTVVGTFWKGISVIRARSQSYHDAQTAVQVSNRAVFKKCLLLSKQLSFSVIKPIWNGQAVKMSGYNLFMKKNFKQIDAEANLSDCEGLVISTGKLVPAEGMVITDNAAVPGGITLNWNNNSGEFGATASDPLRIVAICGDKAVSLGATGATRSSGTANVTLPFGAAVSARVFAFFENAGRTMYSNDVNSLVEVS